MRSMNAPIIKFLLSSKNVKLCMLVLVAVYTIYITVNALWSSGGDSKNTIIMDVDYFSNSTHSKTVVIAAALYHTSEEFKKFIAPLRSVYDGDIVLFVSDNKQDDISKFCNENKVMQMLLTGNRYTGYSVVCAKYEWCFATNFRGTFFQADPFKNILAGYDLIFAAEDSSLTIGNCPHNSEWIKTCWGTDTLKQFSEHNIVSSGAIMGTPKGFSELKVKMLNEINKTADNCDCTARDQGHLNYLLYSGTIKVPFIIQKYGEGIVNAIGYIIPQSSNKSQLNSDGYVLKTDGSVSPVLYRYDPYSELDEGYKVISYSLYGNNPRYTINALINSQLVRQIFPGWTMRVYYDKVPSIILNKLRSENVELIDMSKSEIKSRMSWRFLVASDENVERYIVRDIDSRLSKREKGAVDEWIASKKKFHVLRDHAGGHNYAINGGMWGGTRDAVPDMKSRLLKEQNKMNDGYMQDMDFLKRTIWPFAKESILQHDGYTCKKFGAKSFPTARKGNSFVGDVCDWKKGCI